jgi:hypothetical protein
VLISMLCLYIVDNLWQLLEKKLLQFFTVGSNRDRVLIEIIL